MEVPLTPEAKGQLGIRPVVVKFAKNPKFAAIVAAMAMGGGAPEPEPEVRKAEEGVPPRKGLRGRFSRKPTKVICVAQPPNPGSTVAAVRTALLADVGGMVRLVWVRPCRRA